MVLLGGAKTFRWESWWKEVRSLEVCPRRRYETLDPPSPYILAAGNMTAFPLPCLLHYVLSQA